MLNPLLPFSLFPGCHGVSSFPCPSLSIMTLCCVTGTKAMKPAANKPFLPLYCFFHTVGYSDRKWSHALIPTQTLPRDEPVYQLKNEAALLLLPITQAQGCEDQHLGSMEPQYNWSSEHAEESVVTHRACCSSQEEMLMAEYGPGWP